MTLAARLTDALDYHLRNRNPKMKQLAKTTNPVVIRTDFENQQAWETICDLVRAPRS
jgi:hypothetical protein